MSEPTAPGPGVVPFGSVGSYPTRDGNLVAPLVDGEPAFTAICRAVEHATTSVWVTVTFLWDAFRMPGGRGTFFDVLDAAAARGVDVRVLCWRPDERRAALRTNAFWGSAAQLAFLADRGSGVGLRWDKARPGCAQHQKSWVIDAGSETEVAFVGGINQNPAAMVSPGHAGAGQTHDVYVELRGPAVADVHHNFAQRWNEASERDLADGRWGPGGAVPLRFPDHVGAPRGTSVVQVQRTMAAGRCTDGRPTPGGEPFDIAGGERSIHDQYLRAIGAARTSIYLENQYLEDAEVVDALGQALARGVRVAVVLPGEPDLASRDGVDERQAALRRARAALAGLGGFVAVGLAGLDEHGRRHPVYVHAKLMLVDDEWATIGSANLHWFSQFANAELNVSVRDPVVVRALRDQLLEEHLGVDTSQLSGRDALGLLAEVAESNRRRWADGETTWPGNAFALDLTTYGD